MMWFSRSEFDRNAWFFTDLDVRGGLPWKSICDMQLPIPHPDKQKEIVKEYKTIVNRIALNNRLIKKLEETAKASKKLTLKFNLLNDKIFDAIGIYKKQSALFQTLSSIILSKLATIEN